MKHLLLFQEQSVLIIYLHAECITEKKSREVPEKLLFATEQLHRNLHKATESNHFKLKPEAGSI